MPKYYVDKRKMEIVSEEDLDLNILASELYYEYKSGITEDIIIETWYCGDNKYIDFYTLINNPHKDTERTLHFKRYNVKPLYLKAYTVPPSWFKEEIEKINM